MEEPISCSEEASANVGGKCETRAATSASDDNIRGRAEVAVIDRVNVVERRFDFENKFCYLKLTKCYMRI